MVSGSMGAERELGRLPSLTFSQREQIESILKALQHAEGWSGDLPVLLLNRCWLRLTVLPVERLALELPPDLSRSAPELEHYRELIEAGIPAWQAQQLCWLEFGADACHQALQRFWSALDQDDGGWTLQRYLDLLTQYRQLFLGQSPRSLPLLVLARPSCLDRHGLFWLRPGLTLAEPPMRHTCA